MPNDSNKKKKKKMGNDAAKDKWWLSTSISPSGSNNPSRRCVAFDGYLPCLYELFPRSGDGEYVHLEAALVGPKVQLSP